MEAKSVSIRVLEKVCQAINRHNIKILPSYKKACCFIGNMGFLYKDVEYEESYMVDNEYIDVFSYLKGRILIYASNEDIIGCKIENAPYLYKKFLNTELKDYKVYETNKYIVYEK